jgi:hypothetical protein
VSETLSIIERRRIEAELAKSIYDEMVVELGRERARAILARGIIASAKKQAASFQAKAPGGRTDLQSFADLLPLWMKDDALQIEVIERSDKRFDFNVKRCRYAEMYRAMGLGEIGDILSCNRDGAFCEGYDARIKMTRTQTLMKGASHCDFRYVIEDGDKRSG